MSNITLSTPDQLMSLRATYTNESRLALEDLFGFGIGNLDYADVIEKQILGKITGVYNSILDNCRVRDMGIGNFKLTVDCGKDASNSFIIHVNEVNKSVIIDLFKISHPSISREHAFFYSLNLLKPFRKLGFHDGSKYLIFSMHNPEIYKLIEEKDFLNDADRWITHSLRPSQNAKPSAPAASNRPSEEPAQNTNPSAQTASSKPNNTSSNPSAGSSQTNGLAIGAGCFAAGIGLGIVGDRLYAKKKAQELSNVGSIQPNRLKA